MDKCIGIHLGVYLGEVGETDAIARRVVRLMAAKARKQAAIDAMSCSMVVFVDGGLQFGSLVFHHQFFYQFGYIGERYIGGI